MTDNAFTTLSAKENHDVHHITPTVEMIGDGMDADVRITIPVEEIAKSRKGTNQRGAIGFVFDPIDFDINGKKYRIYPGWTTLTRR